MKKLIFATQNQGKLNQVRGLLELNNIKGFKIKSAKDIGFTDDVIEDGKDFEENSYIKAKALYDYCKQNGIKDEIIFADDSGLCVDKLNGAPGIYSARFAGDEATDEDKRNKILDLLKDYQEDEDRTASFITVMTAVLPDGRKLSFKGECKGKIARQVGKTPSKLTYNQLLIPDGFEKTMSELSEEEFKKVHHHREEALLGIISQLNEIEM